MNEKLSVRGIFTSEGLLPVRSMDREETSAVLRNCGLAVPRRLTDKGLLSAKEVRIILETMPKRCRREFERTLIGGGTKFSDVWENLMTNAGKTYLLDAGYSGGTPITSWFVIIFQAASSPSSTLPTVAAGDTSASHAGWAEVTAYDESTREAWVEAGVSGQAVTNTASRAEFTISANNTYVGGAGLISNSTKGGTTGTFNSGSAFGAVRTLQDNEVHRIGYTLSM